ncbi:MULTISPECIES: ComF family protein [unclassified Prochlorococcus]|nr:MULTISPECIES: ComF family protein [unclassified Prochlorococcus]NMO83503.1 ComF family protein [Prochlorococcus sp. P1344]NMP05855.1 ComF family protein [Prochlorococcus sp. P1361]NMP12880.1 ComF family protein [Prochlorococcus sp.P1363]
MRAGHALLMQPQCPICRAAITSDTECSKPCLNCCMKLDLPADGLRGFSPLNWRALGWYEGHLRRLLLNLRRNRKLSAIHALAKLLTPLVPINAVLVPIPSWKSLSRTNPVPQLLASSLCRPCHGLLRRRHATVGQHHLDRQLRQRNQIHSFEAVPDLSNNATDWSFHQVWIVDDILTTGATALAARNCLQNLGITVGGAICLAKTPKQKSKYNPKTIRNG